MPEFVEMSPGARWVHVITGRIHPDFTECGLNWRWKSTGRKITRLAEGQTLCWRCSKDLPVSLRRGVGDALARMRPDAD